MSESTDVFVIGTGPSGMTAVRTVKMNAPDVSVTAVRSEPSYIPCALPYALGGLCEIDSYLKDESKLLTSLGVNVLDGRVVGIDPAAKRVSLSDGRRYSYGKLIVATGADAAELPHLRTDRSNVFSVRTPAHIREIVRYGRERTRCTVVGGGYVGVEIACMMRRGGHDVTLVEVMDRLLPNALDPEFCQLALDALLAGGVEVRPGTAIKDTVLTDDSGVEQLVLSDGSRVRCGMVILAVGVKPRVDLFERAAIETKPDGVMVDDGMRTSAPDVYACGDCTRFASFITGKTIPGKLATNGIFQGKIAALNVLGGAHRFTGFLNACATEIFGTCFGCVGLGTHAMAKEGIETISATGISRNAYPMFGHSAEVRVKLTFHRRQRVLIGGQVAGTHGVAERIDLIALGIQQRLTAADLVKLAHCAHPLQSGVPAHNPIVMAAEKIERIQ